MKIAVLGAGAWGLSIANLLYLNKNEIIIWEFSKTICDKLNKERSLPQKLPGFKIPEGIKISNDIEAVIGDCEIIVNAVPTQFIRSYFYLIKDVNFSNRIVVNVSKGIEVKTGLDIRNMFLSEFKTITDDNFVIIAGPSFANEVSIRPTPTTVVSACKNIQTANKIRDIFTSSIFRVYSNTDVIGVEIGGSIKNIIAIAAGIVDGLNLGNNTKAALLTRGLTEMIRFGVFMGAKRETFSGLTGIGDMILTCNSSLSRNWQVGNRIGKGESLTDILNSMNMVAEGVETTRIVYQLAEKKNISMPITTAVFQALFNDMKPLDVIESLMSRAKKMED